MPFDLTRQLDLLTVDEQQALVLVACFVALLLIQFWRRHWLHRRHVTAPYRQPSVLAGPWSVQRAKRKSRASRLPYLAIGLVMAAALVAIAQPQAVQTIGSLLPESPMLSRDAKKSNKINKPYLVASARLRKRPEPDASDVSGSPETSKKDENGIRMLQGRARVRDGDTVVARRTPLPATRTLSSDRRP